MAHKKAGGSTALGRESWSQRLGVKISDGQKIRPGQIIIRQRGTKYHLGKGVKIGGDDTIFSIKEGVVKFTQKKLLKFNGKRILSTVVNVV